MSNVIRRGVKRVVHFLLNRVGLKLMARPIRRRLAHFEAATHSPREVQAPSDRSRRREHLIGREGKQLVHCR